MKYEIERHPHPSHRGPGDVWPEAYHLLVRTDAGAAKWGGSFRTMQDAESAKLEWQIGELF